MDRQEQMEHIAIQIETMVKEHGRRKDIAITYSKLDDETIVDFNEFQRHHHGLLTGEEYFFVWERGNQYDTEPFHLLYTKCVTADNALTAAAELMELVAKKF